MTCPTPTSWTSAHWRGAPYITVLIAPTIVLQQQARVHQQARSNQEGTQTEGLVGVVQSVMCRYIPASYTICSTRTGRLDMSCCHLSTPSIRHHNHHRGHQHMQASVLQSSGWSHPLIMHRTSPTSSHTPQLHPLGPTLGPGQQHPPPPPPLLKGRVLRIYRYLPPLACPPPPPPWSSITTPPSLLPGAVTPPLSIPLRAVTCQLSVTLLPQGTCSCSGQVQ
jgi:hypothetical protein